ncbi:MAG: VgrG-related protein [Chloroflexota bacterium]|nr:VgrG-related protein [Anaerolineae bacterium]
MPGTDTSPKVAQIEIKVNGADLAEGTMNQLFEVEVETSLYLPSMFSMSFYDDTITLIDSATFKEGTSVEIKMQGTTSTTFTTIFKGEITAIEPDFTDESVAILVVRGYDRSHRLHRGTKSKVYVQVTDSDIVTQIASAAGLTANVDSTTEVYKHVFQYGVSDWAFIHERARRNGYEVLIDDKTLYFRKPSNTDGTAALAWNNELVRFQPRFSLAKQVQKVTVKGWNPKTKTAIVGEASSSTSSPTTGFGGWGGSLAQTAFSAAEILEVRHPVGTQTEATKMAQAILDEVNAGFLQADGTALGNPALKPGAKVTISKVGTKFSGTYIITTARHIYNTTQGYLTNFTVQGARAQTMADMIDQSMIEQRHTQLWGGIVTAIVTNNNDPENMARVKVKFPWLDEALESDWARVTGMGAGATRGFLWLPEVNDEVLVAFEHGDFDYPYVVGSLWNGTDAMPEATGTAVKNGKVEVRTLKTRLGHIIRLTDSDSAKTIEIIGSDANTNIKFDETAKKITIESKADIDITATGNLNLKATGNVTMEGTQVSINGKTQFEVKGGMGTVQSSGVMVVKGSIVNIN